MVIGDVGVLELWPVYSLLIFATCLPFERSATNSRWRSQKKQEPLNELVAGRREREILDKA